MRFNVIAIDGPTASGKGTIAKKLSRHFGIPYLNTGALYRAVAYNVIRNNVVNYKDEERILNIAQYTDFEDLEDPNLYLEDVGFVASKIAGIQELRDFLYHFQQRFANNPKGAILDGRDIGTVICPDAEYKFFITANVEERAKRRYAEMISKKQNVTYEQILEQLIERDRRDMDRLISPLAKADDAIEVDTTEMDPDSAFEYVLSFIKIEPRNF